MNLKDLPKIELHRHLDCSMRFSTMLELLNIDTSSASVKLITLKKKYLIESPHKNLAEVIIKFKVAQELLKGKSILKRLAFECIEDAYYDGIKIIELRYSPDYIKEVNPELSFLEIHEALLEGALLGQAKYKIAFGFIIIIQRTLTVERAQQTMNFALFKNIKIIGVDLADVEDFPALPFLKLFEKASEENLSITIHAGEVPTQKSIENIKEAILQFNVRRIGHGIQSIKSPEICNLIIDKKIPLEICPSSNVLTQGVKTISDHPVKKLWDMGVPITLNTDDPGIFNINLTHEYELVQKIFQFTENDFIKMNKIAFENSFIPKVELQNFNTTFILNT